MPKTLAFAKFQVRLTEDLRTYWHCMTAFVYARRWWESRNQAELPTTLARNPGDKGRPFGGIDINVPDYLSLEPRSASVLAENAIVNTVTAFEVYLQDLVRRVVYVDPSRMSDSDMAFSGAELSRNIGTSTARRWFSNEVSRRYMYNKSHSEMIARLGSLLGRNLKDAHKLEMSKWHRVVSLRNSLVHTGRHVSAALRHSWPERFKSSQAAMDLVDGDVISSHAAAFSLAECLDRQAQEVVLKDRDQDLFAREMFVRFGLQDVGELAREVSGRLNCKFSKSHAEQAIAAQRRSNIDPADEFDFTHEMLSDLRAG